jgi:hypothetical protein
MGILIAAAVSRQSDMHTVEPHSHEFSGVSWPFDVEPNTAVFSSAQVVRRGAPVLVVYHDHDGEWQFVHGDVTDDDECLLVCLGCAFQRTPSIADLASMPAGWRAERDSIASPWALAPYASSDDEP